jgi:hypothetical protein
MSKSSKQEPAYRIYAVERRTTNRASWTDIGTAYTHRDGKGFDLQLQSMPLSAAELVVRPVTEKIAPDGEILRARNPALKASRSTSGSIRPSLKQATVSHVSL